MFRVKMNQDTMDSVFNSMLGMGESCLSAVYCVYPNGSYSNYGFVAVTNQGRFLVAKYIGMSVYNGNCTKHSYMLDTLDSLKIRKTLFGPYSIRMNFFSAMGKAKVNLLISPRTVGNGLPNQRENLDMLISQLSMYER